MNGATASLIVLRITLPLSRRAVAVAALDSSTTARSEFRLGAIFVNGEGKYTLLVALRARVGQFAGDRSYFAAGVKG